jgi:hypothetical protein
MKHYKDPVTNEVYAYEADGSQDAYIKPGLIPVTNEDAQGIVAANKQAQIDALPYTTKRAMEYPDFRDYLDGVVKGDQAQVQAYIDACLAVKAKYPKE